MTKNHRNFLIGKVKDAIDKARSDIEYRSREAENYLTHSNDYKTKVIELKKEVASMERLLDELKNTEVTNEILS